MPPKPPTKRAQSKRLKSPNDGAAARSKVIVAKIRKMIRDYKQGEKSTTSSTMARIYSRQIEVCEAILLFVQTTDERASAKPGGLGR